LRSSGRDAGVFRSANGLAGINFAFTANAKIDRGRRTLRATVYGASSRSRRWSANRLASASVSERGSAVGLKNLVRSLVMVRWLVRVPGFLLGRVPIEQPGERDR
jgi:hypothetical protein